MRASLRERSGISVRSTLLSWAIRAQRRVAVFAPVLPLIAVIVSTPTAPADAADYGASGPLAQSASGLRYSGATSKGGPVLIKTSRNRRRIKRAVGAIELGCGDGMAFVQTDEWRNIRVSKRGKFRAVYRDSFVEEGITVDVYDKFAGRFNRRRTKVSGTWRLQLVLHEPDGTVDTCDSGALGFKATR